MHSQIQKLDMYRITSKAFKYFIFGLSIATVSYIIFDNCKIRMDEILMFAVVASVVYAIFDIRNKSENLLC